jgi:hypothetical protein
VGANSDRAASGTFGDVAQPETRDKINTASHVLSILILQQIE